MDGKIRPYLVELIGTFILVFVAAGTVCASYDPDTKEPRLDLAGIALAEGCALAAALTLATRGGPTGFLNPAMTVTLWVCKRLDGVRTLAFIAAQVVGAVLAGLLVRVTFNESVVLTAARLGTPHLKEALLASDGSVPVGGILAGGALEMVFTAIVALAVFATLIDPRRPHQGGIGVGIAQVAIVLVGFNLTGGCANPVCWLGPAVWQNTVPALSVGQPPPFADHTVYWVGPVLGALLGGVLYSSVILPPER